MNYYIEPLIKYAVFSGRARRKEYWSFMLLCFLAGLVLGIAMAIAGSSEDTINQVSTVLQIVIFIPSIAVGVRRMHDLDKSGWFVIIPLYNLYLACLPGTKGPNKYGPDPKEEDGSMANV